MIRSILKTLFQMLYAELRAYLARTARRKEIEDDAKTARRAARDELAKRLADERDAEDKLREWLREG